MGAGREFEGKSLHEALRAAATALGGRPESIRYEVLSEGRRGMFGLGARQVRIWVDHPDEEEERPAAPLPGVPAAEDLAWADETIRAVLHGIGLDVALSTEAIAGGVRAELLGPDRRLLIARDAELLSAIQFLLNRMASRIRPGLGRVIIECKGYREQRDRQTISRAHGAAREVERSGSPVRLGPFNAYERRLVHMTVQEYPGLATRSEGDGFMKVVEIFLSPPKGEA